MTATDEDSIVADVAERRGTSIDGERRMGMANLLFSAMEANSYTGLFLPAQKSGVSRKELGFSLGEAQL
ncbi:hypothetical protein ACFS7Z_14860 [Pontibacter toksunensis]|uniref:Uncharacterized protein n=1 Tax=Pontibacter toksunensis TaxID=1332631 RepID=A0ABW6BUZ7_9BACT